MPVNQDMPTVHMDETGGLPYHARLGESIRRGCDRFWADRGTTDPGAFSIAPRPGKPEPSPPQNQEPKP